MKLTLALFVVGILGLAGAYSPVEDRGTTLGDELQASSSETTELPLAPISTPTVEFEEDERPDEI